MIHRHIAWINSLRVQLRQPKSWAIKENSMVEKLFDRHGEKQPSCDQAKGLISAEEYADLQKRVNAATHLVKNQANQVTDLKKQGVLDGFQEDQLHSVLEEFYNLQGKCERIKNTPFPGQYGYFARLFTTIFILLIPLYFTKFIFPFLFHSQVC